MNINDCLLKIDFDQCLYLFCFRKGSIIQDFSLIFKTLVDAQATTSVGQALGRMGDALHIPILGGNVSVNPPVMLFDGTNSKYNILCCKGYLHI